MTLNDFGDCMILNGEDPSESLDLRSHFQSLGLGWVWTTAGGLKSSSGACTSCIWKPAYRITSNKRPFKYTPPQILYPSYFRILVLNHVALCVNERYNNLCSDNKKACSCYFSTFMFQNRINAPLLGRLKTPRAYIRGNTEYGLR